MGTFYESVFSDLIESSRVTIVPEIETDPFTGKKTLQMVIERCPDPMINEVHAFSAISKSGQPLVIMPIAVNHGGILSDGALLIKCGKLYGTCLFSVLFDDGTTLEKEVEDETDDGSFFWQLTNEDCEEFLLKKIHILRAETTHNKEDYYFEDSKAELFQLLIERFLEEAAKNMSWAPSPAPKPSDSSNINCDEASFEDEADYCYVYLMNDTANGYYKIGMSNNPEYRESTLQSEKPTIVKVCQKKLPSRKLAHALETALHRVFENKRVRGEWFSLTEKDIWEIKQSLT